MKSYPVVAFLGDSGVGKTTWFKRLQGKNFIPIENASDPTIFRSFSCLDVDSTTRATIYDYSGNRRYEVLIKEFLHVPEDQLQIAVLFYDSRYSQTLDALDTYVEELSKINSNGEPIDIILVGTYADETEKKEVDLWNAQEKADQIAEKIFRRDTNKEIQVVEVSTRYPYPYDEKNNWCTPNQFKQLMGDLIYEKQFTDEVVDDFDWGFVIGWFTTFMSVGAAIGTVIDLMHTARPFANNLTLKSLIQDGSIGGVSGFVVGLLFMCLIFCLVYCYDYATDEKLTTQTQDDDCSETIELTSISSK